MSEPSSSVGSLSCLSYHLIGLSPTYWTYNPLLIGTIHKNMILIHGVDAFILKDTKTKTRTGQQEDKNGDNDNRGDHTEKNDNSSVDSYNDSELDDDETMNRLNRFYGISMDINDKEQEKVAEGPTKNLVPDHIHLATHIIPICKCEIVGVLQYVHRKSNGSTVMIVDDGTGLIDCIHWQENDDDDGEEEAQAFERYRLLHYNTSDGLESRYQSKKFVVGDLVRVRGQMRVLSIDHASRMIVMQASNQQMNYASTNNENETLPPPPALSWEGYFCTREIQVHSIEKMTDLVEESLHWLRSLQFIKRMKNTIHIRNSNIKKGFLGYVQEVDSDVITDEDFCSYQEGWQERQQLRLVNTPIYDGLDIFNTLSNEMKNHCIPKSLDDMNTICTINDTNNNLEKMLRNYFGRECRCGKSLRYMDELLYCHCLASNEALDTNLIFRDALLLKLLEMESTYHGFANSERSQKQEQNRKRQKVETTDLGQFQFKYSTIYKDEELLTVANETVSKTSDPKINLRRLFINTFQHLRNDGIVYLVDIEQDTYILLSKTKVLAPCMQKVIAQEEQYRFSKKVRQSNNQNSYKTTFKSASIPSYLKNIPTRKYRLLKRMVEKQRSEE